MAGKRLSDTNALVENPGSAVSHTVSTRKIDNGWLIRQSSYNEDTGECRSSERFSDRAPKIAPARVGRGSAPDEGSPLRGAMDYLKD
jgi:hypothetical protein